MRATKELALLWYVKSSLRYWNRTKRKWVCLTCSMLKGKSRRVCHYYLQGSAWCSGFVFVQWYLSCWFWFFSCVWCDWDQAKYRIVRDWYAGQIHDSSPVDFVYTVGANFVADQLSSRTNIMGTAISWSTHCVGKALDFAFHSRFEKQRADMWNIAYRSGVRNFTVLSTSICFRREGATFLHGCYLWIRQGMWNNRIECL
jgi:hypothetical protein